MRPSDAGMMVCRHMPPFPGVHLGRCSCPNNPAFAVHVFPASRDMNSADGSTPQYITSGSPAGPMRICQICLSARPDAEGNLIACSSRSVHVAPKSSLDLSDDPKNGFPVPAHNRCRPARPSNAIAYTGSPRKYGPDIAHLERDPDVRNMNAPLVVPTSSNTRFCATLPVIRSSLDPSVREAQANWMRNFAMMPRTRTRRQPCPAWNGCIRRI